MTISWGIIGCGDVNETKSGPAFGNVSNSKLIGVMRRNSAKAKDFAERHNVPCWYDNADDLIANPNINAIYIATPPKYHEEYALQAIAAGKNVYVEKPMSTTVAACEQMSAAAATKGVKLVVAHYRRQLPMYLGVKKMLEEGVIGAVRYVRLTILQPIKPTLIANSETYWRVDPSLAGGGLFYDLAPHQLDLVYHFFGKPQQYYGFARNQAGEYAAEDIVTGVMLLENNVFFNGIWCFSVAEGLQNDLFEIEAAKGRISFHLYGNEATVYKDGKEEIITFNHPKYVQQPMIEQVVQYFLGKADNPCPAQDAIESMKMMESFVYGG